MQEKEKNEKISTQSDKKSKYLEAWVKRNAIIGGAGVIIFCACAYIIASPNNHRQESMDSSRSNSHTRKSSNRNAKKSKK